MCGVVFRLALRIAQGLLRSSERGTGAARPAIRDRVRRLLDAQATREKAGSVERVPPAESDSRSVCQSCATAGMEGVYLAFFSSSCMHKEGAVPLSWGYSTVVIAQARLVPLSTWSSLAEREKYVKNKM